MGLKDKILEIIGDEEKTDEIVSSLHEFMIPKDQYDKTATKLKEKTQELNTLNSEFEEAKKAQMSEQEKMQFEIEKAEKVKQEFLLKTNRLDAEKLFVSAGIAEDDYKDLIDGLVSPDAEKTKQVVSGVANMLKKERDTAIAKTKEEMLDSTPRPQGGNDDSNNTPPKTKDYF